MARNNTVPSGQIGTGAAFLLGGSRAFENWVNQDQRNAQVRSYNSQQQKAYQDDLLSNYNKNKVKTPVGQAYQAEIMSDVQKLNDVGAKYLSQGFDVYNPNFRDPNQVQAYNQFMQDRALLENKIKARERFDDAIKTSRTEYEKNPYGFENTPDVYTEFEQANPLTKVLQENIQFPSLRKAFDYNKNITEQIPALFTESTRLEGNNRIDQKEANVPAITGFVDNLLTRGENRNWVERQIGGSLDGLLKTTDKDEIRRALDSEFRSPSGLDMMAELNVKGKVPAYGSPEYKKFLDDAVNEQLKAEEKFDKIRSNAVQDGIAKVNPSYKKLPDFSLAQEARARRAEQRSIESNRREQVRFNERNKKEQDEVVTYRQQFLDDLWNEVPGSGERLKSMVQGKGTYDGDLVINLEGNKINFQIPSQTKRKIKDGEETTETIPARRITVDRSNPSDVEKLNLLVDEITGEEVPTSKINTKGGKGTVKNNLQGKQAPYKTTISRSEIASRASAAGYSIAEYEQLLKKNGVKIQ